MLAIIYSDPYYTKIIPGFLTIPHQLILMSEVKTLKPFLCVLIVSEPTPEFEIMLQAFSGFKIAMGLKNASNLYNYIYTHNYNHEQAFIPDLRLLLSKPINKKLNHCACFINYPFTLSDHLFNKLNILKTQLEKRYTISVYCKKFNNFEDLICVMSTVNCAICSTYESFLAAIVTRTPIYPICCNNSRSRDLLEQIGLLSYNYDLTTDIITWYQSLNKVRDHILEMMDRFHKQSLFLFHKHPINRLIALHVHDTRDIIFNVLHHTDDYWNGARLLADFILKNPDSPEVPIIYTQLSSGSESLIDRIHSTTRELLQKRSLIISNDKREKGLERECLKLQAPHLFTTNLIIDYDLHQTFIEWFVYMIYKGIIPYTNWWAGILKGSCEPLFEKVEFIQSLHRCRFIGVFSQNEAKVLKNYLNRLSPHTKVYIFNHL